MKVRFWGTRGSVPTPGRYTIRYGGNTPCVEVRLRNNELIVLDAGTGIRCLGDELMTRRERVKAHILVSHPHWDHIQGFPFFRPAFVEGNEFTIIGSETETSSIRKVMSDQMNSIYFPVNIEDVKAMMEFRAVEEETLEIHDGTITTCLVNHPAFALGFRLSYDGGTVVYISDNEPFDRRSIGLLKNLDKRTVDLFSQSKGDVNERIYEFCRDADVLIHDSTYTPEEYASRIGWGHSHYLFSLQVARNSHAKQLVLFHHDPSHNDAMIDGILETCRREIQTRNDSFLCVAAAEGMEIDVP
jgi:phosphoribosyl 1,2-cyclic phosphodiesterase